MLSELEYQSAGLPSSGRIRSLLALSAAILAAVLCLPSACIILHEVIAPPRVDPTAPPDASLYLAAIAAYLASILVVLYAWWSLFPEERRMTTKAAMLLTIVNTIAVVACLAAIPLDQRLRRSESINGYLSMAETLAPTLANNGDKTSHDGQWSILCGQLTLTAASPAQRQSIITAISSDIRKDDGRVMCFGDGKYRYVPNEELDRVLDADDLARRAIGAPSHSYYLRTYMGVRSITR